MMNDFINNEPRPVYIATTAPVAYDYSYMTAVGSTTDLSGQIYRVLETTDEHRLTNYQIPRYRSGMYATMGPTYEWGTQFTGVDG